MSDEKLVSLEEKIAYLQNMIDDGVMSKQTEGSRWAALLFYQPKKTMDICFLANFQEVNKQLNENHSHYQQ